MTGGIRIEAGRMREAANIINSESIKLESIYSSLKSSCERLKEKWEGTSADAYIILFSEMTDKDNSPAARQIIASMKRYAEVLEEIAQRAEALESSLGNETQNLKAVL